MIELELYMDTFTSGPGTGVGRSKKRPNKWVIHWLVFNLSCLSPNFRSQTSVFHVA